MFAAMERRIAALEGEVAKAYRVNELVVNALERIGIVFTILDRMLTAIDTPLGIREAIAQERDCPRATD